MKMLNKLFGKKKKVPQKTKESPKTPKRYYGGRIHKLKVYKASN